jgi:hypothetical protein
LKQRAWNLFSIAAGLAFGVISLLLWYSFLSSFIPPKLYRPLHHWMYGLALLFLGLLKRSKNYGKFSISTGFVFFADDFLQLLFFGIFP